LTRLRNTTARRKWIVWVSLLLILLVAVQIGVSLLPHHVLNAMLQVEEKSNGVQEVPAGVPGAR
jgi:uncharacterized protein involved in exopolysaccharide biosynthesis